MREKKWVGDSVASFLASQSVYRVQEGLCEMGFCILCQKKIEDCNNDPQELSSYSIGWSLTAASFCPSHGVLVTVGDSSCPLAGRRGLVGRASS